nr:MAG TPA: hypothetical protein [Caudoviricetes sp.]
MSNGFIIIFVLMLVGNSGIAIFIHNQRNGKKNQEFVQQRYLKIER